MPSPLPSSFASAAAGNTQDSSTSTRKGEGVSTGEWSRNRMNGATQTFRRPSLATTNSHNREGPHTISSASTAAYIPPHLNSSFQSGSARNGGVSDNRYTKDQLLSLYKSQRESGNWGKYVTEYFMADWNPCEGTSTVNGGWNKKDDYKDSHSCPEICWDHSGQVEPLALSEMNDEEKDLFSTSVNSPLKPPPLSVSKDNNSAAGTVGRKSSVSHSQSHLSSFSISSSGSARPGTRRRGTGDSMGNTVSPTSNSRFFRDDPNTSTPPASLLRRKTDFRESSLDANVEEKEKDLAARDAPIDLSSPFASLKRSATNPVTAGPNAPTSLWPSVSHSTGFSPMGAFGSFSLGPITSQGGSAEKKTSFGSLRGESRFKGLLSKDTPDDVSSGVKEKPSLTGLDRLPEAEDGHLQAGWGDGVKTRGARSETNPFGDEPRSGSAALGGQDMSNPVSGIDQFGLSPFGLPPTVSALRDLMPNQQEQPTQTPTQVHNNEPMSPTNTNPYQSPQGEKADADDIDTDGSDIQHTHLPGLSELREDSGIGAFGSIRRGGSGLDVSTGDRSQTSSVGAGRGYAGLGGLGGLSSLGSSGGWPSGGAIGTPSRERPGFSAGFGDPIFGSMADMPSPSVSTLGVTGSFFGPHTIAPSSGNAGRTSKMGSLFPPAMQDQMRGEQVRQEPIAAEGTSRPQGDGTNRNMIGGSPFELNALRRDQEQASRGSGPFSVLSGLDVGSQLISGEDSYLPTDKPGPLNLPATTASAQIPIPSAVGQNPMSNIPAPLDGASHTGQNLSPSGGSTSSNQVPATQQRQMVMPDRMRWIYRDPQGNTQGPWSGLEMHDWFKAGFFTAELQVKKVEDAEYEPLAQLVRRIGNSREPFLVPQIGIPHGPPPNQSGPWGSSGGTGAGAPTSHSGTAQPPFPSSFPSFGTTLTAEQQNALERRKQEEQYLMARQKEHLAQQQVLMKQMHLQGASHPMHPHQLQHHSSAHSLHSQPSYGSITSPAGYQPSSIQGPIQPPQGVTGFFEPPMRQNALPNLGPQMLAPDLINREDELPTLLDRLNVNRTGQFPFNTGPSFVARQQENSVHSQQVATMLQDRARLQHEQEQYDLNSQADPMFDQQAREERLRQFHALRRQTEDELAARRADGLPTHPTTVLQGDGPRLQLQEDISARAPQQGQGLPSSAPTLSLSQQVQKAASAQRQQQQSQSPIAQTESPWAKVESGMPQPFPPPSSSPLPAPAAQRNRQNVADALAAGSRSQSQTPIETPTTSVAPWAKESNEGPKGPSLKEIQEAEARKAAKLEEIATAARRALAEQERANPPPVSTPGLPSSANWASAGSPATPSSAAPSVWTKPLAGKSQATPVTGVPKKTLAQIQKEEEARKQRLAVSNAAQAAANYPAAAPAGKRYADLAGKIASPTTLSGTWTTVGAGGKPKLPPAGPRSLSGNVSAAPVAKPRPVAVRRAPTLGSSPASNPNKATEELTKWAKIALGKGLNSSINVDDFVQQLLLLPPETEIISDSVYANSQTLDGRRFAEEFVRRRKLADKGIVDPVSLSAGGNGFGPVSTDQKGTSDGWNEVAKKGPSANANREDNGGNAAFKVVAAKKKGKR